MNDTIEMVSVQDMPINDGAFIVEHDLEVHPIALIMPPMNQEEFEEFKEDVVGNGLIEPIVLFEDKIIDGRNRYNACKELEIDVWARQWEGGMDPVEYVVSKNIHRRQLTPTQRATAAAKALNYHSDRAKERQREAGQQNIIEHHIESGHNIKPELVSAPVHELNEPANSSPVQRAVEAAKAIKEINREKAEEPNERRAVSQAGKMFNVSGRTVAGAKYVLDHGTEEEKEALETGKAAVKTLEKQVRERESVAPKAKPTFNKTTDSIKWAKWTWNPVTGCKHGCPYCYARDIANRYPQAFPQGFEPTFHPERLEAPQNTKLPDKTDEGARNVFVCSMADLFGDWVPDEWIQQVLDACEAAPDWNFLFLTKNPKRLPFFTWPENAFVGASVDRQSRVRETIEAMEDMNIEPGYQRPSVLFISCEPLLEPLDFKDHNLQFCDREDHETHSNFLKYVDLVIIGAQSPSSGSPEKQPEWAWVESLHMQARKAGCKVYWKTNLKVRPEEYPEVGA